MRNIWRAEENIVRLLHFKIHVNSKIYNLFK